MRLATTMLLVGLSVGTASASAANDQREEPPAKIVITSPPPPSRPAVLLPLYVGFGALQAYDGYTTTRGVREGHQETNPLVGGLASQPVVFWSIKAASTAVSIYFAEQLWRQDHPKQAIVMMVVANGVFAAVAARNMAVRSSRR